MRINKKSAAFLRRAITYFLMCCATIIGNAVLIRGAAADDFRVESKVYAGQDDAPSSESLALFSGDRVYDFLTAPREITVFDFSKNRIVLLDPVRQIRTELTTDKLTNFGEQLRSRASRQTDPLLKFAAEPKFEESRDDAGWLKFSSPLLTYRVQPAKVDSLTVVKEYRQFCDCSARLNSMLHPGAMPPFPRLAVNAALERSGQLPEKVEVTIVGNTPAGGKPTVLRSEHKLTLKLASEDHKRIDQADENLTAFKQVKWDDYLLPVQQAKR